jgi:hypothetical protein
MARPAHLRSWVVHSKQDLFVIVAIFAILLAVSAAIDPRGNFPLNDDWAYGWSVRHLLETGEFRLSDWAAANLFSQVMWGALFGAVFGFSFTVLRFSTLILAVVGTLALYALQREMRISRRSALVGSLTLALAPIHLQQAHTFNNDVPSTSFLLIAAFLLVRGLVRESPLATIAGLVMGSVALLARQSSLALFVAFGLACLATRRLQAATLVKAILPGLVGLATQFTYAHWLSVHDRKPLLYDFQIRMLRSTLSSDLRTAFMTYLGNASVILMYAGLFLFPLLVYYAIVERRASGWRRSRTVVLCAVIAGVALLLLGGQMPLLGNTLLTVGLGPPAAPGSETELSRVEAVAVDVGWKLATVASIIGVALLLLRLAAAARRIVDSRLSRGARASVTFVLACLLLYVAGIAGIPREYVFDRYLLPLLALAIPLIGFAAPVATSSAPAPPRAVTEISRARSFLALLPLLVMAWYGVVAVHDYMASHRVRWRAIDVLVESQGVPLSDIDGGFEFSGWHGGGSRFEMCSPGRDRSNFEGRAQWKDFDCIWEAGMRQHYAFSFTERPGMSTIAVDSYFSWQFLRHRRILTVRWGSP